MRYNSLLRGSHPYLGKLAVRISRINKWCTHLETLYQRPVLLIKSKSDCQTPVKSSGLSRVQQAHFDCCVHEVQLNLRNYQRQQQHNDTASVVLRKQVVSAFDLLTTGVYHSVKVVPISPMTLSTRKCRKVGTKEKHTSAAPKTNSYVLQHVPHCLARAQPKCPRNTDQTVHCFAVHHTAMLLVYCKVL